MYMVQTWPYGRSECNFQYVRNYKFCDFHCDLQHENCSTYSNTYCITLDGFSLKMSVMSMCH